MTSNPTAGAKPGAPKVSFFRREARSSREAFLQGLYFGSLRLLGNPLAMIGLVIIVVLVLVAAFAPLLASQDPLAQDLNNALQPPSAAHWFGTDELGRDIYSRVVYGSRVTLYIVGLVTVTVAPIGIAVGTTSGYFGGSVDTMHDAHHRPLPVVPEPGADARLRRRRSGPGWRTPWSRSR